MSFLPTSGEQSSIRSVLKKLKVKETISGIAAIFECFSVLVGRVEKLEKLESRVESLEKDNKTIKRKVRVSD